MKRPESSTRIPDLNALYDKQLRFGERIADNVASFGGSWTFIFCFLFGMGVWMYWNARSPQAFDPYPYIFLNLVLSCLAALQAPIIMMSQNRQAVRDRLEAHQDFEINVQAEAEIMALNAKIDRLEALLLAALETRGREEGRA